MNYELSLLVDAIESRLTKEKRPRGKCDKIFILPIKTCTKCSKEFENIMVSKI